MECAQLGPPMVHLTKFDQNRLKDLGARRVDDRQTDRQTDTQTRKQTQAIIRAILRIGPTETPTQTDQQERNCAQLSMFLHLSAAGTVARTWFYTGSQSWLSEGICICLHQFYVCTVLMIMIMLVDA